MDSKTTSINTTVALTIPVGVVFQETDGESVAINLNSGLYFGFDEVGTRIWQAIASSGQREAAIASLTEVFDVTEDQAKRDVDEFIITLESYGLVEARG